MKKIICLLILFSTFTLNSCNFRDEPPHSLSGTTWRSQEIAVPMPGNITLWVEYYVEFLNSKDFALTQYVSNAAYGETVYGSYYYNRPQVEMFGNGISMRGKAQNFNYIEIYDELYDFYLDFRRI